MVGSRYASMSINEKLRLEELKSLAFATLPREMQEGYAT
jgi:hypothetical protein